MSVSVTKAGPYFSSGSISFSQLRSNFKETSSGSVSASELRRNTNTNEANPVVPDSTENEQISTGSNLSLSQFRNSVKRYFATQTGTDDNSHGRQEPGFRMGLYDPYGRGIDWSGGGLNGRDGQGGNNTGNHIKNVQKFIEIRGTCGSVNRTLPAAQLAPRLTVNNVRISVFGSILGQGGLGGYNPEGFPVGNASGEDGGIALNFGTIGVNNTLEVRSGARIYGGGGGGEQGLNGARGSAGTCMREYSVTSCGGTPSCSSGGSLVSTSGGSCCEYRITGGGVWSRTLSQKVGIRRTCVTYTVFGTCRISQASTTPIQGIGGRGGNGQGYNQSRTNGENGSAGTCPTCPGGLNLSGGECATNGGRGGDGGDWAQDGGETAGGRTRGRAGAAVGRDGSNTYSFNNNGGDVRGAINI
jgi:hypothetical protein